MRPKTERLLTECDKVIAASRQLIQVSKKSLLESQELLEQAIRSRQHQSEPRNSDCT